MKILITNGHLHTGGVENSLISLLSAIDYSKHQVDLLLFEGAGDYLPYVPDEVSVHYCDIRSTYGSFVAVVKRALREKDFRTIGLKLLLTLANKVNIRFTKLLTKFTDLADDYDLAIAYRVGMPADYVAFAAKASKKCVWWHNGQMDAGCVEKVDNWRKRFELMDKIICVSESAKELFAPYFLELQPKMLVIPNIVNSEEIRRRAAESNPFGENAEPITRIVSVGRLSDEKHMCDIPVVAGNLVAEGYRFHWYVIGDGPDFEKISVQIRDNNLQEFVVMTGSVPNPYPYIKNADIYVHPSFVESQGLSVLEAMVLHKPCVVVKSAGTCEYIVDGVNAYQAEQSIASLTNKVKLAINTIRTTDFSKAEDEVVARYEPNKIINSVLSCAWEND